ncbi:VOC family protein [Rhizobium sp. TH2]|uniref:VOC family protein n=1 Tax=Rhizobium sp. TH2 TaxID=2775403 RepID=UPI0021588D6F|nr:VOC family protein [Rhizobium sp. TH2]
MCAYLTLRNASEAIDFYRRAFGAEELFRLVDPGDGRIGHAEMSIGGQRFFVSDEYPDFGAIGPDRLGGTTVKFHLDVDDVDAFAAHAVSCGAVMLRTPKDEFHGYRTCLLSDPFGYGWFIASKVEEVSAVDMQRRWTEMMGGAGQEATA